MDKDYRMKSKNIIRQILEKGLPKGCTSRKDIVRFVLLRFPCTRYTANQVARYFGAWD